jgi:hypothetical protein
MNQDKLDHMYTSPWTEVVMYEHMYTSPWTEVVMYEPGQTWSHVHLTMNWSSNVWTHVHLTMNWSSNVWTLRCTCVHALLLQFMVRCTCDQVCPGSYITTSVHGEVHMYTSSWTEVVMHEPGQTWSHVHLTMNWSSNAWTRTNFITCTPHHEQK